MKYNHYPKRDAVKNYFPLPDEIFSLGLCDGGILVYTYLMYREDRKTFQCYPIYKTIRPIEEVIAYRYERQMVRFQEELYRKK